MAYWNPFGWDEETRRSIQSIVRPVMQVASVAASAGAFSGGEAAASTTPDAATAPGADFDQPSTAIPTDPNDMGTLKEWTTDQDINAPSTPVETPGTPQATTMQVPSAGTTTGSGLTDPSLQQGGLDNQYFKGTDFIENPSVTFQPQEIAAIDGQQILDMPQSDVKGMLEADNAMNIKPLGTDQAPGQATITDKPAKTVQTTTQKTEAKAKTADTQEIENTTPKPEGGDGKGPGGNKEKNPLEDGFTWENIQKFLASAEGKKWLLSDKGLMGIGRKLSAAADAGVGGGSRLSSSERKKIKDKLKKYREGIRKKREDDDE